MNNTEYRKRLVNRLLSNGYTPILENKLENGEKKIKVEEIYYLQKDSHIINLIEIEDGDLDILKQKFSDNKRFLESIKNHYYFTVMQAFLFDENISDKVKEFLQNSSVKLLAERKFLISCSIIKSNGLVERHFGNDCTDDKAFGNIKRAVDGILDVKGSDWNELDKVEMPEFEKMTPTLSYTIIGINVTVMAVVFLMDLLGFKGYVLVDAGSKVNSHILDGQWWRLITPVFLHAGAVHLLGNSLSLYFVGPFVETIYGRKKFMVIYLLAGIGGNIASFFFNPNSVSVGASGAIYGLVGAIVYFIVKYKKVVNKDFVKNIVFVILLNLFIGFSVSNIDNSAHLGGLVSGFIISALVGLKRNQQV